MKPGIYNNISNEAYHASEGISRSGVMAFRKSPLHYWYKYINTERKEEEPTHDMIIGNAFHTYILEPNMFEMRYLIFSKTDKRTKEGKEYWSMIESIKENKELLSEIDFSNIKNSSDQLLRHEEAIKLIKNSSYEHSIYWRDPFTDVLCKARPDIMCENYIADIKTTDDASPEAFRYSIRKYGYHVQASMLLDAMNNVNGTNCKNFIIIAVEKKPPYATAVYVLDEPAIDIGREIYKSTLIEYKKCLEENNWPSYQTQTISI